MDKVRYKHLNSYLKDKFGERTLKVCIDSGFTCPNRDGVKGCGGCIFCGSMGAGENIKYKIHNRQLITNGNTDIREDYACENSKSVRELRWQDDIFLGGSNDIVNSIRNQVVMFLNSYRGERAEKFIAYFQSFTNTYADIDSLRMCYDAGLNCSDKFVGLQIATRPDCIDEEVVALLKSYKDKYYVCVELGLQTANDDIGRVINRGYTTLDFEKAVRLLHASGIDVVVHIMVGLPNEKPKDVFETVELINRLNVNGVKIHSTYVQRETVLEKMYRRGAYSSITQEYYVGMVGEIIKRLNRDIVIHRITADPPCNECVAPQWVMHKKVVLNSINRYLADNDIVQGMM